MRTLVSIAAFALCCTTFAAPAAARDNAELRVVNVNFDDLNLASPRGQKILERRIRKAAEDVCGYREEVSGTRIRKQQTVNCYEAALNAGMTRYAALLTERQLGG